MPSDLFIKISRALVESTCQKECPDLDLLSLQLDITSISNKASVSSFSQEDSYTMVALV